MDEIRVIDPLSDLANEYSNEQLDYINYGQFPDADFSYERNERIINETIDKNEKQYLLKRKIQREALGERADMMVDFLMYLDGKKKDLSKEDSFTEAEKYFGKKLMSHLYGEKLAERLRTAKRQQEQLGKVLI